MTDTTSEPGSNPSRGWLRSKSVASTTATMGTVKLLRSLRAVPGVQMPVTNEELLVRAGNGDRDAYAALYEAIAPMVYGLAKRVIRDHQLAEDVAQEALVEVWRQAPRFDPERGKALSWVATIAHRRAIDRVRSEQSRFNREHKVAADNQTETTGDEISANVLHEVSVQQIERALAVLSPNQRDVIQLAFYDGRTYAEVAEQLSIPLGTAKTRIRDSLIKLRESAALAQDIQ